MDSHMANILLCYLLYRIDRPVQVSQLYDIAVGSNIINYFAYQESISYLTEHGSVQLRRMPEVIEYAAPAGLCTPAEGGRAAEGNADGASTKVEAEAERVQLSDEPRADSAGGEAEAAAEHDAPAAENSGEDGLLWFSRPDGTLTAFDGRGSIVAIPAELRRDAPGAVIKKINGRIYMLFRY